MIKNEIVVFLGGFMKKKCLIIMMIFSFLCLTGCGSSKNNGMDPINNNTQSMGRMYNLISLQDKGITMFNGIIPEGWSAKIYSQDQVNSIHPFVETIVITNPDNTARIVILSQNSYLDNSKFKEGKNKDYYSTYLHTMNSNEYSDYYMSHIFQVTDFVKNVELPQDMHLEMNALHNYRMQLAQNDLKKISTSQYGVSMSVGSVGASISKRVYQKGNMIYETSTAVSSISSTLLSQLDSSLNSYQVLWYIPYTITYEADSQENYDKYYDDYNFIIANSGFTKKYYAMVEYVSSAIVNAVTSVYAERSRIALEATNNYINSKYSSTSSQSTNDKIMEMWDDVIKEQDSYILEDGTQIKTSIMNDTVAQNGNEIYIGDKAGIPIGFNEVAKGYN
jgi:hypothetical protein